jgi:hypothetical protein
MMDVERPPAVPALSAGNLLPSPAEDRASIFEIAFNRLAITDF